MDFGFDLMQVTPESMVSAAEQQISCQLDNEAALLNLQTGVYYGLDQMGAYIWQRLAQPVRVRELAQEIAREYDVDLPTVEADLIGFLAEMINAGLVQHTKPGV